MKAGHIWLIYLYWNNWNKASKWLSNYATAVGGIGLGTKTLNTD